MAEPRYGYVHVRLIITVCHVCACVCVCVWQQGVFFISCLCSLRG